MDSIKHVTFPIHRDKASAKVYDANGKYLFWISLAGESNALDALREKGESWLDFRNRTQPMRDAMGAEELSIADFMVDAINALFREKSDGSWNAIDTCPIREPVDLWCVYGGEEFAQFDGGASIGKLVSNRIKTDEYGFFGNQSNDGVPQRDAPDLVPVAWRKAVPNCPAEIIAEALGIPLTLEDALKEQADA